MRESLQSFILSIGEAVLRWRKLIVTEEHTLIRMKPSNQTNMFRKTLPFIALLGLSGTLTCSAALLVYEGFNYAVGANVLTPLNGGTGFSAAWVRAEEGANDSITVASGVPGTGATNGPQTTVGNLDGVFSNSVVKTSPTGSSNRYIDGASGDDRLTALRRLSQSAGALAGADKVLWASILWTMNGNNFGRQVGFVLGTDGLRNR